MVPGASDQLLDARPLVEDRGGSALGRNRMGRLAAAIAADTLTPLDGNPLRFGPCVRQSGKVVCGGLNCRAHAGESGCVFR